MRNNVIFLALVCAIVVMFSGAVSAADVNSTGSMNTTPLTNYSNIYVQVANDEGVSFNTNGNETYYIQQLGSPNGGFNAVHIANDSSATLNYGGSTITTDQSGTLYATDTGGRGYQDDVVLMLAVNGTIPDNFAVTITASGYNWTPTGVINDCPVPSNINSYGVTLNETFNKSDFIYGAQNWKPTGGNANYPIYIGENMSDASNAFYIMFIDTHAGLLGSNYKTGLDSQFINNGAVQIDYMFENLQSLAAFNIYAWNWNTTQGQGMLWTNSILPGQTGGPSGYTVMGAPSVQTPVAGFTANTTTGTNPVTVQFTDSSSNNPTSWSWDFGDGNTSTEQNPTHTYTKAGNYTVSLTATNAGGNNTLTQTNYIVVSQDTVPPVINGVDPANGASNLPVNQTITVTFSEPIQAGAAYDKIKVITPDNKAKTITKTINGSTLTITSAYSYNFGDTYKLVIPVGAVTDLAGNNLTTAYNSNFTIGSVPSVVSVDPVNGASDVATTKTITVTFNDNVTAGAAYDQIKVITSDGKAKTVTKTLNGNTLTLTAAYSYTPGTYTVYIPKGAVQSLAGNNMTGNYNSTFTVSAGPTISNVNSSNISTTKTVVVTFNGNISAGANFSKIKVITADGKAKIATVTISGNQLIITAAYNYTPGSYTLSIPANSLVDSNGNAIVENYTTTLTA